MAIINLFEGTGSLSGKGDGGKKRGKDLKLKESSQVG